jgi:hypothetical protein
MVGSTNSHVGYDGGVVRHDDDRSLGMGIAVPAPGVML